MPTSLSIGFQRLYCDATVFDPFSALHPISFRRVLLFQSEGEAIDNSHLIDAEEAHLAERNDATRRGVVEEYFRCGLLTEPEAIDLRPIVDFFDADFFELMGLVYANAGRFRCALRWYRELIRELETRKLDLCSDQESVYASVGYCLYSLGLFEEAIAWSKACIGPRQMADVVCQALIACEVQPAGGMIRGIERSGGRARYTISTAEPVDRDQTSSRIKDAMSRFAPVVAIYLDWVDPETLVPSMALEGYPFKAELDAGSLLRHRMNLIFATCGLADALVEKGYVLEAKRQMSEVAILEPNADFVQERLRMLG